MKAALIPSFGHEPYALRSSIHLALPIKDTMANNSYLNYLHQARELGHFIIVDNGAAEGQLVDDATLFRLAVKLGASEVVAPDVLGNMHETLLRTQKFLRETRSPKRAPMQVMAVLQGQNLEELEHILAIYDTMDEVTTIGIPKVLVSKDGYGIRASVARMVLEDYPGRFQIHLLGLSPYFPSELAKINFPPEVRSTDSAAPFKAAEDGIYLQHTTGHHKRREDYFRVKKWTSSLLLHTNILTYFRWAARNEGGEPRS
jgi:hypothetical protein